MRPPKVLRIGGREWRISRRPSKDMDGAYGLCHYDEGRIEIAQRQKPFTLRDTVLHECLHAILAHQGRTTYGNPEEELYVSALATGLMAVFQDNPEFAQWLTEPLTKPP